MGGSTSVTLVSAWKAEHDKQRLTKEMPTSSLVEPHIELKLMLIEKSPARSGIGDNEDNRASGTEMEMETTSASSRTSTRGTSRSCIRESRGRGQLRCGGLCASDGLVFLGIVRIGKAEKQRNIHPDAYEAADSLCNEEIFRVPLAIDANVGTLPDRQNTKQNPESKEPKDIRTRG